MGLFTPPHKKIIAKSPAYFAHTMLRILAALEASLDAHPQISKLKSPFRAAVVGRLALNAAASDPGGWSADALGYIQMTTRQADKFLPAHLVILADSMVHALLDAMAEEIAKQENSN